jgi:hypothetical protein
VIELAIGVVIGYLWSSRKRHSEWSRAVADWETIAERDMEWFEAREARRHEELKAAVMAKVAAMHFSDPSEKE